MEGSTETPAPHAAPWPTRPSLAGKKGLIVGIANEVGAIIALLCRDAAQALTGIVVFVDAGYHVMG